MTCRLVHADAAEALPWLAFDELDAIVTDPPSSVGFMGLEWDGDRGGRDAWVTWLRGIMELGLAALKPGAHALVWALPKRSHWTALALEDAGFEIRDVHHHIFGQGMPKHRASLKPAVEHWILGRKPFRGSLKGCVAKHGTGGLNIEACRIDAHDGRPARVSGTGTGSASYKGGLGNGSKAVGDTTLGRWPAHLSLDEFGAAVIDEQSVERGMHSAGSAQPPQAKWSERTNNVYGSHSRKPSGARYGDSGGASRFFYVAKPSPAERSSGGAIENDHATVKSIALMRWLVRLITPPGGTVLDPFAGSGTTGIACAAEGISFIGIEQSAHNHDIARQRLQLAYGDVSQG